MKKRGRRDKRDMSTYKLPGHLAPTIDYSALLQALPQEQPKNLGDVVWNA
jgi:hypothetical protein